MIRLIGAIVGALAAIPAFLLVRGAWGFVAGFAVLSLCTFAGDWIWRRNATAEEIRQDLEDRVRNPPS